MCKFTKVVGGSNDDKRDNISKPIGPVVGIKGRFRWPRPGSEATMTLSAEELHILLGGANVEQKLKRNEVLERQTI